MRESTGKKPCLPSRQTSNSSCSLPQYVCETLFLVFWWTFLLFSLPGVYTPTIWVSSFTSSGVPNSLLSYPMTFLKYSVFRYYFPETFNSSERLFPVLTFFCVEKSTQPTPANSNRLRLSEPWSTVSLTFTSLLTVFCLQVPQAYPFDQK